VAGRPHGLVEEQQQWQQWQQQQQQQHTAGDASRTGSSSSPRARFDTSKQEVVQQLTSAMQLAAVVSNSKLKGEELQLAAEVSGARNNSGGLS
jgi:hypothetical protein